MGKINAEMRIGEIISKYPETLPVFKVNGFEAETTEALIKQFGEELMIQTVLKVKEKNVELFIKMLEERIDEHQSSINFEETDQIPKKKLNFLGYTYCPLKLKLKDSFEEMIVHHQKENETTFEYFIPSGCGGCDPYENVTKVESIEQFPDVVTAAGFGEFFSKEFIDKFVKKGYFKAVQDQTINKDFEADKFKDANNWFTMHSVFPYVILIDKKRIGELPIPQHWSDLINPIYKNNINIGNAPDRISEALLLYIYQEHGEEGIRGLSANVKDAWHGSKQAKIAGTNNVDGAAVYVIPWFFAKSCPRTEDIEIIWPEEGAIVTPLYSLVKESTMEPLKAIVDFITGLDYAKKSAETFFPVLHPEVDNKLPEGAKFKWLGWDYILSNPIDELLVYLNDIFHQTWNKNSLEKEEV